MSSLEARKAVLEQTLQGLLCISRDTEEALRQARYQLTQMKDDDSDSEEAGSNEGSGMQCQQRLLPDYTHAGVKSVVVHASGNDKAQTEGHQQAEAPQMDLYIDTNNEEDMSLPSELTNAQGRAHNGVQSTIVQAHTTGYQPAEAPQDNNFEEDMSLASEDEEEEGLAREYGRYFEGYEEEQQSVVERHREVKGGSNVQSLDPAEQLQIFQVIQGSQGPQTLQAQRGSSTARQRNYSIEDTLEIRRGGILSTMQSMHLQAPSPYPQHRREEDGPVGCPEALQDFSTIQTKLSGSSDTARQGFLDMTKFPPPQPGRVGGMKYEVRVVSAIKNEVPLLTKINPALQVDVARLYCEPEQGPLFWSLQVECAEHQTKWELATFVDEASSLLCKRSRTEFSDSLLIPVDFSSLTNSHRGLETLPDVQLRAEREVWDPRARACQAHRHRFNFRIGLVNAAMDPVSHIAFSSPFRLAPGIATLDDSIADQVLKARRVVRHMGDDEIRDRTGATSQFVVDEREQLRPQVLGIDPKEITITGSDSEYSRVEITGKNFHQACIIRADSDPPNEIQRATFPPTSRIAGAFIQIPKTSELMMLKVRNFDDPNLISDEYQFLSFKLPLAPLPSAPINLPSFDSDIFADMNFFELSGEVSRPFPATKQEKPAQECRDTAEPRSCPSVVPVVLVGLDKFEVYHHIVNGYTHTVAAMLQTVEFKKLIKMKFGMVPALLALLSENPCTFILCLTIHAAEQQEVTEDDFKQILEYICNPNRNFALQPNMLFDFLQNEIGIDVRARFKKMASLLAESMVSDAESMIDDDSSDYSPEDTENYSTSDEDYEDEPPSKILRSNNSGPGSSRLRLSIKVDKPIPYPSKIRNKNGAHNSSDLGECDWEGCLLCERDMPIMLQTQNPTWAAIMRVVFYSFINIFPNCEFWMVRQAYKYIEDHWEKLCPGKDKAVAWRKQLQDALSHNKQYFISGMDKFGQKGYWGLKQISDPWAVTDQEDQPKRAYNHQPRRGRPPKSSSSASVPKPQVSRRESNSYIYKCLKHAAAKSTSQPPATM